MGARGRDHGWWTRNEQGWLQNKNIVGGPGKLPGLSECDKNALRRAAEIRDGKETGAYVSALESVEPG